MSVPAKPVRSRRGRVMIVGAVPNLARLSASFQQPPVLARTVFDAIGELATAPTSAPIATVVLAEQAIDGAGGSALQAMRTLDPAVKVIMVARRGALPADWVSRGYDDCVIEPLRPDDLRRLFDDDMLNGELLGDAPPIAPAAERSPAPSATGHPQPPVIELPDDQPQRDVEPPRAATVTAPPAADRPSSPVEAAANERAEPREPILHEPAARGASIIRDGLGDTDLVEAIMSEPGGVRDTALRLIAQQTGWDDIALEAEEPGGPAEARESSTAAARGPRAAVDVNFNGESHGRLATACAPVRELRPWAEWLARWLALDRRYADFRAKSFKDDLTGAWNRRYFEVFLRQAVARAATARRPVTLMVFDIDNFKLYNDQFGHDAGDDILKEAVRLMNAVIRQGDRACRIGGDEFAVVFADPERAELSPRSTVRDRGRTGLPSAEPMSDSGGQSTSASGRPLGGSEGAGDPAPRAPAAERTSIEMIARRFQEQICAMRFPKLGEQAPGSLSISAGLATYPWDGHDPATLLRHADQLALQSKRAGKNIITFGPGARRACRPGNDRP